MADQTYLEILKGIIAELTGASLDEIDKIAETATFAEDLQLDELDMVELFMAVEDEFGVEIWEEHEDNLKTVGELLAYIEKALES